MGWTERKKILTSYEEIVEYLKTKDGFHDNRIGYVDYNGSDASVTVEQFIPGAKPQDSTALIWDFHFKGVTCFEISVDVVAGLIVSEAEGGTRRNEIVFDLDSGFISIAADQIKLGIPS